MNLNPRHDPPDDRSLSRLLRLGRDIASTPVRRLLARLDEPDARAWLDRLLGRPPLDRLLTADRSAFARLSADELLEIKSAAKSLVPRPGDAAPRPEDDAHLATLVYFLVLAAGRVHHDRWLTAEPPQRLAPELWDLSTALHESLGDLVAQAAESAENDR